MGAACFPPLFRLTGNKGRSASMFALLTGICMIALYFFSAGSSAVPFYAVSCLAQFFFSGFNTAIYAIIPDCVEYGEWKTGLRNDGLQDVYKRQLPKRSAPFRRPFSMGSRPMN